MGFYTFNNMWSCAWEEYDLELYHQECIQQILLMIMGQKWSMFNWVNFSRCQQENNMLRLDSPVFFCFFFWGVGKDSRCEAPWKTAGRWLGGSALFFRYSDLKALAEDLKCPHVETVGELAHDGSKMGGLLKKQY